jgi:hypothetical protein
MVFIPYLWSINYLELLYQVAIVKRALGSDFSKVTLASIKKAQDILNDRPRKTLGFLTPHEVFSNLYKHVF